MRGRSGVEKIKGELAQLARALAWHARGRRFDSDILHKLQSRLSGGFFYLEIKRGCRASRKDAGRSSVRLRYSPQRLYVSKTFFYDLLRVRL